ncbi:HET-domain-containing protein [Mollisia scopiformis]|uniref:HET-domain-containing protein n=1 Tax=Mollisia scopiformis TaxID=149040 RepID=A0A194XEL5_MOLSC|nr:HET-domain-containing protein [Mollisia scopiformis]KUJ18197.1 HET-domain-containing protein [Mollisia scopiformis]
MHRARKVLSRLGVSRSNEIETLPPPPPPSALDFAKRQALGAPTEDHLAELQSWYTNCQRDETYYDWTLEHEVLNEEQLAKEITDLVPSTEKDLKNGYCGPCNDFPSKWSQIVHLHHQGSKNNVIAHMIGLRELEAACRAGCRLCRLFMQHICPSKLDQSRKVEKRLGLLGKSTALFLTHPPNKIGTLYLCHSTGPSHQLLEGLIVFPFDGSNKFSPSLQLSDWSPVSSIVRARQWLAACSQEHPRRQAQKTGQLPARLLYIRKPPAAIDQPIVQLVETKDLEISAPYAALSHCWGRLDFVKLTSETLDSFKTGIPFDILTKTFQEAIQVTLNLGLQYLWIDSLCIIQDSVHDWEREASLMSSVYGHSHVTIAASSAKDGSEGLFLRPPDFIGGALMGSSTEDVPTYAVAYEKLYAQGITSTHLSSRAWTLQERLLSHRTLYFGEGDVFWECWTKYSCEFFPDGMQEPLLGAYDPGVRPNAMRDSWREIIVPYSSCKMTKGSDKLVALAGVAREAQRECGDTYVAGLWRTGMEEMLCWRRLSSERPQNEEYRAPSWSWASVDGGVEYYPRAPDQELQLLSKVHHVSVTPLGPDPFGQLKDGILTISCPGALSGVWYRHSFKGNVQIQLPQKELFMKVDSDVNFTVYGVLRVILLPMVKLVTRKEDRKFQARDYYQGLVLQPTLKKKGEYRRIGSFSNLDLISFAPDGSQFKERHALEEHGPKMAGERCAEIRINPETGEEEYLFNIV